MLNVRFAKHITSKIIFDFNEKNQNLTCRVYIEENSISKSTNYRARLCLPGSITLS